jgi:hypothetical protein
MIDDSYVYSSRVQYIHTCMQRWSPNLLLYDPLQCLWQCHCISLFSVEILQFAIRSKLPFGLNNMLALLSDKANASSPRPLIFSNPSATPTLVTMIDLGFSIIHAFLVAWNQSILKKGPILTLGNNSTICELGNATICELYLHAIFLDYFTTMVIITSFEEFDSTENLYRVPLRITRVISISP